MPYLESKNSANLDLVGNWTHKQSLLKSGKIAKIFVKIIKYNMQDLQVRNDYSPLCSNRVVGTEKKGAICPKKIQTLIFPNSQCSTFSSSDLLDSVLLNHKPKKKTWDHS